MISMYAIPRVLNESPNGFNSMFTVHLHTHAGRMLLLESETEKIKKYVYITL